MGIVAGSAAGSAASGQGRGSRWWLREPSLAARRWVSRPGPGAALVQTLVAGKQLVHYTAQPLFLVDSSAVDMGSGDLPIFFELGEGPYFTDGDEYSEDPTISLLSGTEQPKPKDPAIS